MGAAQAVLGEGTALRDLYLYSPYTAATTSLYTGQTGAETGVGGGGWCVCVCVRVWGVCVRVCVCVSVRVYV